MSIPLDRLYDHLYHKSNHDILIYGWIPHGSKKLEDFSMLRRPNVEGTIHDMTTPMMIMHDQEPLDFNLWSRDDFALFWERYGIKRNRTKYYTDIKLIDFQVSLHLRSVTENEQNLYDYTMLAHSEQNSVQVDQYRQNGFIPIYYWSHALIAVDWFRYAVHDPLLEYDINNINKDFLIYNRAWSGSREYRLTFIEMLANSELASQCLTTFSPVDDGQHYTQHQFKNPILQINHNRLQEIFPLNQHPSSASADYNSLDYTQSGIEVVLETLFDDTRWHLTEKTLRPIACGKSFMLAATPGSLQYLKNYGFETFGEYINEEYDLIANPRDRLQAIISEMTRIAELPVKQKKKLWQQMHRIAKRNQQRFFSSAWQDSIEQEFYCNIDRAINEMKQNCTGKHWKKTKTLLPSIEFFKENPDQQEAPEHTQILNRWLEQHN
jgi:hypothetical protein